MKRINFQLIVLVFLLLFIPISSSANSQIVLRNPFTIQSETNTPITGTFSGNKVLVGHRVDLHNNTPLYGLGISADIKLLNEASLARVILIDSEGNEYLVFETYTLLADTRSFSLSRRCEETKLLNAVIGKSLRIELIEASITLHTLNTQYANTYKQRLIPSYRTMIHEEQQRLKIDQLNTQIGKKAMSWIAGSTSLSHLTYAEKKHMFYDNNMLANLQGFEYYAGGVFDLNSNDPETISPPSAMIDSFDWRDKHGSSNKKSPYYDENKYFDGWSTSIKSQSKPKSCGSCWAHSTLAAAEMMVNLYYNKHIDMNLAEQQLMECSNACTKGKGCKGGFPLKASQHVVKYGIVEEECFPYVASDAPVCGDSCKNPKENLKFKGYVSSARPPSDDSLKSFIIHRGPLNVGISSMRHAMCLVGFQKDASSGKTVWIFKNSHGLKSGTNGYTKFKPKNLRDFASVVAFKLPVMSLRYSDDSIRCVDLDEDGYYNWGIGPKPKTCPECPNTPDCDDSRNDLGPMESDGSCKKITTGIKLNKILKSHSLSVHTTNRFNRLTIVRFKISKNIKVSIKMYTVAGTLIKSIHKNFDQTGLQQVIWDGTNNSGKLISNGTYLCRITIDDGTAPSIHSFKILVSR